MTVINNVPRDDFQREERYVVVKISKMHPHPEFRRQHLAALKAENSAALVDCLVIEKDWPEYEVAWSMIEARVTGATAQPAADADAIAWRRRDGVLGCKRFMTQSCYDAQSPAMKAYYEPYRCAQCGVPPAADGERADPIVEVLKNCLAEGVQPTFSGGDLKHLIKLLEARAALPAKAEGVEVPIEFVRFLLGEGEFNGYSFGDTHQVRVGKFWWRSDLRAWLAAAPVPPVRGGEKD